MIRNLNHELTLNNYSSSIFEPHITITSGLNYEAVKEKIENGSFLQFINKHSTLMGGESFAITDIEMNDNIFFKSVVLKIDMSSTILEFVKLLRREFISEVDLDLWMGSYKPHLSLVYSNIHFDKDHDLQARVTESINQEIGDDSIYIPLSDCMIEVVECVGPPEQWTSLYKVCLD